MEPPKVDCVVCHGTGKLSKVLVTFDTDFSLAIPDGEVRHRLLATLIELADLQTRFKRMENAIEQARQALVV